MTIKSGMKLLLAVIILSLLNTGCTKSKGTEPKNTAPQVVEGVPSKIETTPPVVDSTPPKVDDTQKPSQIPLPEDTKNSDSPKPQGSNSGTLVKDDNYILPESQKKRLNEETILTINPELLPYARNEIFARRGYIFSTKIYKDYFASKSWYKPNPNFSTNDLSSIEIYNINLIKYFEDQFNTTYETPPPIGNTYKADTTVSFDLNGDGIKEKIIYRMSKGELAVNNKVVKLSLDSPAESFAIVDLDTRDNLKEILISDYGPSDDYITYYYYFDGANIVRMGKTGGLFEYGIRIDGAGKINAQTRASILQTWFFSKPYQLSSQHKVVEVHQDLYQTDYSLFLKISLKLYKNRGDSVPSLSLSEGQTIKIISTDDIEWCLIETTNGTRGWIALDNFNIIRNNGLQAVDVFAGLCYAD